MSTQDRKWTLAGSFDDEYPPYTFSNNLAQLVDRLSISRLCLPKRGFIRRKYDSASVLFALFYSWPTLVQIGRTSLSAPSSMDGFH